MKILFLGTPEDKSYLAHLKPLVGDATVFLNLREVTTWTEALMQCKAKGATAIISTSLALLKRLTFMENSNPSINNYAGSLFKRDGIEILFIDPLKQLITVHYGKFLTGHFIKKLTAPKDWIDVRLDLVDSFNFTFENPEAFYEKLSNAYICAVDIETSREPLAITTVGFTCIDDSFSRQSICSYILPMDSVASVAWLRKFVATDCIKVFQNGKYDLSYLTSWGAPVTNYAFDTATMFHSLYSELPKDLGFLQAFFVRNAQYWKDLAQSHDRMEQYRYNALDTWGTLLAALGWLHDAPKYAKTNFLQEFPLLFPCHLCEMTGVRQDEQARQLKEASLLQEIKDAEVSLSKMVGVPQFNAKSSVQVKKLLVALGCADIADSSDEKTLKKAAFRHPLNAHIVDKILDIRGLTKLASTYLSKKDYHGRILYSLNPHGTDTGRLASREHHFWTGLNIQNIPRGKEFKHTIQADDDFELYECDLEQAESRDTAFASGDEHLITAVSGTRDFHSINASAFFGRSYESIYDDVKRKSLDKPLRDLAKRVNHGANYLMGEDVLVDTMGLTNIYAAAAALKLPKLWTPKQIAADLLGRFHKTYPYLSQVFYPAVVKEVMQTKKLSSKATHDAPYQAAMAGWVRACFKDPSKDKRAKNAYVAHVAQSLNAMTLNKAFMRVFYELALAHPNDFRLLAQIHDSIFFMVRKGRHDLAIKVKEFMEVPVRIQSYDGKVREFTVPAELKGPATRWSDL